MHFSSLFNITLLALFAAPGTLAHPVATEDALYTRGATYRTAIEARQLERYIHDMIQRRALDGEDAAVVEARLFPLLRILGKGARLLTGLGSSKD